MYVPPRDSIHIDSNSAVPPHDLRVPVVTTSVNLDGSCRVSMMLVILNVALVVMVPHERNSKHVQHRTTGSHSRCDRRSPLGQSRYCCRLTVYTVIARARHSGV